MNYEPVEVGVALSLYGFNVSPVERAKLLFDHFRGDCAEPGTIVETLTNKTAYVMTELAPPTAEVYVIQALARYGDEAKEYVRINRKSIDDLLNVDLSEMPTSTHISESFPRRALHLSQSSWKNLLNVVTMCVPVALEPKEKKTYLERTGKEWTVGDFWDSVRELRKQLGQED